MLSFGPESFELVLKYLTVLFSATFALLS